MKPISTVDLRDFSTVTRDFLLLLLAKSHARDRRRNPIESVAVAKAVCLVHFLMNYNYIYCTSPTPLEDGICVFFFL